MLFYLKRSQKLKEFQEISERQHLQTAEDKERLEFLKDCDSFKGRLNFKKLFELFNFEENIYGDKTFRYQNISNYNKRLIPEFASASLAQLIFSGAIKVEIRAFLEQYLIAMMSNMDYINLANLDQIKKELSDSSALNLFAIIGSCPRHVLEDEYTIILNERLEAGDIIFNHRMWTNKVRLHDYVRGLTSLENVNNSGSLKPKLVEDNPEGKKLTQNNLKLLLDDVLDSRAALLPKPQRDTIKKEGYNLILVSSSYQIPKLALELEKYFYNVTEKEPENTLLVGAEKFFQFVGNSQIMKTEFGEEYKSSVYVKKMQSFLFEVYMHTLDRNKNN